MKFRFIHRRVNRPREILPIFVLVVFVSTFPLAGFAEVFNDYNGDGVSDLALYAPGWSPSWYIRSLDPWTLNPRTIVWNGNWSGGLVVNPVVAVGLGAIPSCVPVPGDYNGDGKCDGATYSSGAWAISYAGGSSGGSASWGTADMIPVPGDYDGDGKADLAVYQPSMGRWYIRTVSGTVLAYGVQWGTSTMIPVTGDYDGDGRSDFALYDRTTARWYIRPLSSGNPIAWALQWGGYGMVPVPGDYNGDGRSDLAMYQESSGRWYIRSLSSGNPIAWGVQWGYSGAVPVPGDYDGDGRYDLCVYDCVNSWWYVLKLLPNSAVLTYHDSVEAWGTASMMPVGVSGPFLTTPLVDLTQSRYSTAQLSATGGFAPYRFTAMSPLPAGLSLSPGGLIAGTTSIRSGAFWIRVSDSYGCTSISLMKIGTLQAQFP